MRNILLAAALLLCLTILQQANACNISEDMLESVPLNYTGIPNAYRIKMADRVANARQWPDVEIQAQIVASSYVGEKHPAELAESRGKKIKEYLIQLGIKPQYIYIDTHITRSPYPTDSTGRGGYMQIGVSLLPLCKGGCERLCDSPRVTPNTKAIK
ncbi:hypothetical protein [Paraburkholderia pallida]|uniref:OmpA-like domain-containing protein n=1 Tax=Paraburkholderia pallida TaxID=2547399 RepID=A0A4P7CK57_9BURK|nr:hypothetical protein [Paraburkholderia pallida]QBQ96080.1 hypothetical protein E1956_02055 [Paraburkholderia pallida]